MQSIYTSASLKLILQPNQSSFLTFSLYRILIIRSGTIMLRRPAYQAIGLSLISGSGRGLRKGLKAGLSRPQQLLLEYFPPGSTCGNFVLHRSYVCVGKNLGLRSRMPCHFSRSSQWQVSVFNFKSRPSQRCRMLMLKSHSFPFTVKIWKFALGKLSFNYNSSAQIVFPHTPKFHFLHFPLLWNKGLLYPGPRRKVQTYLALIKFCYSLSQRAICKGWAVGVPLIHNLNYCLLLV